VAPSQPTGELQAFKARFFKALAHPIRIRLVELLVARDRTVQELQTVLTLDQSSVSQHLAVLRANHVVTARKLGTTVRYALRDPLVGDLLQVARRIFSSQLTGTQDMLRELKREHRRG
jgi:DNA-binding transcriptional ArsR family regulator